MNLYICHWADNSISLVIAHNIEQVHDVIDEWSDPSSCTIDTYSIDVPIAWDSTHGWAEWSQEFIENLDTSAAFMMAHHPRGTEASQ